jgi:hypothetical protein
VGSTGGSLFQRLQANGNARPQPGLPQREPATPTVAFDAIDESSADATDDKAVAGPDVEAPKDAELEAETPQVEAKVEEPQVEAKVEEPAAEVEEPAVHDDADADDFDDAVAEESALDLTPTAPAEPSATPLFPVTPLAPAAEEPAESWVAAALATPTPPPAPVTAYDLLDSRSPLPEPTEDETPIFRTLRSNWLTAGAGEDTWTTSEIEAGWEAAEQVAEAPSLQLSDSGLPMRRPGKRLVPGGVSPAPVNVERDPEAIRARLAAHAAGVSRGRTRAVDESVPTPSSEEGPA